MLTEEAVYCWASRELAETVVEVAAADPEEYRAAINSLGIEERYENHQLFPYRVADERYPNGVEAAFTIETNGGSYYVLLTDGATNRSDLYLVTSSAPENYRLIKSAFLAA